VTDGAEFRYNVIEIDAIEGTAHQAGDGWFDLEMGITLGERKVRLEPLLADLFRRDRRWLSGALETIADERSHRAENRAKTSACACAPGSAEAGGAGAGRSVRRPGAAGRRCENAARS
jgi:hypothetical protein